MLGSLMDVDEFISEPIRPDGEAFDARAMATGAPGLPTAFVWRQECYTVVEVVETWKESSVERGRPSGEMYLRRHVFRARMSDDKEWIIYFIRQGARGASPKRRWFLLGRNADGAPGRDDAD